MSILAKLAGFLNLDTVEIVWLLVSLCVVALLVVAGVIIYCNNREIFGKYVRVSVICLLVYTIVVIAYNVIVAWLDGSYTESYQLWVAVGVFLAIAVVAVFAIVKRDDSVHDARAVAMASVCIAISFALSYIRLFKLPQGGSITMASLTLLGIYSYMYGIKRGVLAGIVYGVLQSIQDPWVVHPIQYILDYPLAFAMIGLVGVFKGRTRSAQVDIALGFVVAIVARYICHFFSGSIFFGEYGADFGIMNAWAWGSIYNLFVFVDGAIAWVVASRLLASRQIRQLVLLDSTVAEE